MAFVELEQRGNIGIVTMNRDQAVYVEALDPETGLYFGMPVYYGYGLSGAGLDILSVGNEVRIVGTLQYYEAGGTWQVSGLSYRMMKPNDPGNIQKLSDGHSAAYASVDARTFAQGQVTLETEEGAETFPWAQLALGTPVSLEGLYVQEANTTLTENSSSYGAITLTCTSGGFEVLVRTEPMHENGTLITEDRFVGQTIAIKGVVDFYDGAYQIRVLTNDKIIIE